MSDDKRYIVKGSIINLLGTLTKVISPLLVLILARIFSQEEFGMYISVQVFAITLSRITVLGLDKGLIWFIPRNQKLKREPSTGIVESIYFSSLLSLIFFALSGLFLAFGGLEFFSALKQVSPVFIILCLFSLIAFPCLYIFAGSMEGIRLPAYKIIINQFLVTSLAPVLAILLRLAGTGENALPLGFTISNFLGCLIYLVVFKKRFPGFSWARSPKPDRELLNYSLPLGATEILAGLLVRVDLWMITLMLGPKYGAVYSIMLLLANGLRTIRQGFDPLIVPIVSKMHSEEIKTSLKSIFSFATNMVTSIQIVIITVLILFTNETLSLAGSQYAVEARALAVLLVGNLVNGMFGLNGVVILGLGKSKAIMVINITTLILNISLNLFLIPRLGITGAALGTTLAYVIQNFLMLGYQYKLTSLNLYQNHLMLNLLLIIVIILIVSLFYNSILMLNLGTRLALFGGSIVVFFVFYLMKKNTFKIKGSP